jgi:hypothetical protein
MACTTVSHLLHRLQLVFLAFKDFEMALATLKTCYQAAKLSSLALESADPADRKTTQIVAYPEHLSRCISREGTTTTSTPVLSISAADRKRTTLVGRSATALSVATGHASLSAPSIALAVRDDQQQQTKDPKRVEPVFEHGEAFTFKSAYTGQARPSDSYDSYASPSTCDALDADDEECEVVFDDLTSNGMLDFACIHDMSINGMIPPPPLGAAIASVSY